MKQEQMEKTLETLKCYHELDIVSSELENVISEKHQDLISDLITEIENISNLLMDLENELYFEYIKQ